MPTYHHKETGQPVKAVQFTNGYSIKKMAMEFACLADHYPDKDVAIVGGVDIRKGQYAVQAFPAIVAIDQEKFDQRYKLDERQLELF